MCDGSLSDNFPPQETPQAKGAVWREPVRHVIYGSKPAIALTISVLHVKGYAETREWSKPLPTQVPGEYMSILRRLILLENS